jgi:hypothetical protein
MDPQADKPVSPQSERHSERPQRAGFWATIRAVLWGFVGIRKRTGYVRDATSLDPKAVIFAGLLAGLMFVLAIVALVRFVVLRGVGQ